MKKRKKFVDDITWNKIYRRENENVTSGEKVIFKKLMNFLQKCVKNPSRSRCWNSEIFHPIKISKLKLEKSPSISSHFLFTSLLCVWLMLCAFLLVVVHSPSRSITLKRNPNNAWTLFSQYEKEKKINGKKNSNSTRNSSHSGRKNTV